LSSSIPKLTHEPTVKVKSEEYSTTTSLKMIIENSISTKIALEYAETRFNLYQNKNKNINQFQLLKNDLNNILSENKIKILTHTSVCPVTIEMKTGGSK